MPFLIYCVYRLRGEDRSSKNRPGICSLCVEANVDTKRTDADQIDIEGSKVSNSTICIAEKDDNDDDGIFSFVINYSSEEDDTLDDEEKDLLAVH